MVAPIGALVRLSMDWSGPEPPPSDGDYVLSNGGTYYAVLDARPTSRRERFALSCIKLGREAAVPAGTRVVSLTWYPRGRRRNCQ